jgi:hypothetical protein
MLQCLPIVMEDEAFALKGGTAINFFVRDMPRLSVDIDLTYLPIAPREASLKAISDALDRSGTAIRSLSATVEKIRPAGFKHINKLLIRTSKAQVKIEPNTIIRGTVFPAAELPLVSKAQETFETALNVSCLDEDELYAGKICAALDRQHPRDLFDMRDFFSFRKLTDRLGQALVIYIASSPRPMHELLSPNAQDISKAFAAEFQGMTAKPVSLDELLEARTQLFASVLACLSDKGKKFLLTLKTGDPDWELIDYMDAKSFPAINWKLQNLKKINKSKRQSQLLKLQAALER